MKLDISHIPAEKTALSWVKMLLGSSDYEGIVISEEQSETIFCGNMGSWDVYQGKPIWVITTPNALKKDLVANCLCLHDEEINELNIRHAAEMAGLEAQIEQNAILGAANIIEAERKKWVEEVRGEIESLKKSKDWGDISSYESHEVGVPKGFNKAIDDILNLPSLQEEKLELLKKDL